MKPPKLLSLNRICYALVIAFTLPYVINWYYEPRKSIVQLDEWGESKFQFGERDDVSPLLSVNDEGDYTPIRFNSTSTASLRVVSLGARLEIGEGYLICQDVDYARWALIPKEQLKLFERYKRLQAGKIGY